MLKFKPYVKGRWITFASLILIFILRIALSHSYYVVAYFLGIYLLQCFVLFLSPKLNKPRDEEALPSNQDNDYKVFIRKLPEFVFWRNATLATIIAFVCAFIPIFNIPVYAPLIFGYLALIAVLTLRQRIMDMIKNKYVPFTTGKKQYNSE